MKLKSSIAAATIALLLLASIAFASVPKIDHSNVCGTTEQRNFLGHAISNEGPCTSAYASLNN